ncbi:SAM-dependent methyltransferase [Rhodocista pekingensis]|uniref:SAM-dependent methyltransferase n=1 Tax=Rhodocista pekingensis TaxID=201185 RepID=A0ABW2KSG9_9PROT
MPIQSRRAALPALRPTLGRPLSAALLAAAVAASMVVLPLRPAVGQYDVPYVPTPQPVVDAMLEMAQVGSGDYLIDLGSGDGRIVVTAAQKFGTPGMGVDLNPERIAEGNANAERAGVTDKVKFVRQDLFKTDISDATVLTMYLLPQVNLRLRPVVLDTLAPGTRIVSHAFDMGDWTPDETRTVEGKRLFRWVVPAKVSGTWDLRSEGGGARLTLDQTYQQFDGAVRADSGMARLTGGRLEGKDIRFTLAMEDGQARTYTGTVEGDRMSGTVEGGGTWTAERTGG